MLMHICIAVALSQQPAAVPAQQVCLCCTSLKELAAEPQRFLSCRTVHNDVYKIIEFSIQKSVSGELAQRALDWWGGLVEHLFGLPVRTPEQEKAVVPASEDHSNRVTVNFANLPSKQTACEIATGLMPDGMPVSLVWFVH